MNYKFAIQNYKVLWINLGFGSPLHVAEYEAGRGSIGKQPPAQFGNETERESPKKGKNLLANVYDTWPRGIVKYKIDAKFNSNERVAIAGGIADITDNTCIQFADAGSDPTGDYIFITTGVGSNGCFYSGGGYLSLIHI